MFGSAIGMGAGLQDLRWRWRNCHLTTRWGQCWGVPPCRCGGPPHCLCRAPALVTQRSLPLQFDFTSYQGVLFVMLMVLFFGGIILAVILPYQYVSNNPRPSFLSQSPSAGELQGSSSEGCPEMCRNTSRNGKPGGCRLPVVQSDSRL